MNAADSSPVGIFFVCSYELLEKMAERLSNATGIYVNRLDPDELLEAADRIPAGSVVVMPASQYELVPVSWSSDRLILTYGTKRQVDEMPMGVARLLHPFRFQGLVKELDRLVRNPPTEDEPWQDVDEDDELAVPSHILVVDDDKLLRKRYRKILESAGYRVTLGSDGEEGWKLLLEDEPELVISDIEMPNLNGYELCERVKQHPQYSYIPVLIASSLDRKQDLERAFASGTDGFVMKPIVADEILRRVKELLSFGESGRTRRDKLLFVDSSCTAQYLVRAGLRRQGFRVLTAGTTEEARSILKESGTSPALVVCSFDLPQADGFELRLEVRRDKKLEPIPWVFTLSEDSKRDRELARAAGAADYVVKPFTIDRLLVVVERVLGERRSSGEAEPPAGEAVQE